MRTFNRRCFHTAFIFLSLLITGNSNADEPRKFCGFSGVYNAWGYINYDNVPLSIPDAYTDNPRAYKSLTDKNNRSWIGRVNVFDFSPMPYEQTVGKIRKGQRDWAIVLISYAKSPSEIYKILATLLSGGSFLKYKEYIYTFNPYNYGLLEVRRKESSEVATNVFISKSFQEDGIVRSVIVCDKSNPPMIRSCNHYIEQDGVEAIASYELSRLELWPGIEANLRSFVRCAISSVHK